MLSSLAILVLLRHHEVNRPVVLWVNTTVHEFLDVHGARYAGPFLDELKHPNGIGASSYQPWALITYLSLPYMAEQPSFATGPRDRPVTAGLSGLWWEPGLRRTRSGFARDGGNHLWFGEVTAPKMPGPAEIGTATGPWKAVAGWKTNGKTTGPKFVLKVRRDFERGSGSSQLSSTAVVTVEAKVLANWPRLALRVQAYDPNGESLLGSGSMAKNRRREYWFTLETVGSNSHPTKLGSVRIETRPYVWHTVKLGTPP